MNLKNTPGFGILLMQKVQEAINLRKAEKEAQNKVEYIHWNGASFRIKSRPTKDTIELVMNARIGSTKIVPVSETHDSPGADVINLKHSTVGLPMGYRRGMRAAAASTRTKFAHA